MVRNTLYYASGVDMAGQNKETVITFKVDRHLSEVLEGIPNRSAFIRKAILSAIDSKCPLCNGTGILTAEQRGHWEQFTRNHHIEKCDACKAYHIVCEA